MSKSMDDWLDSSGGDWPYNSRGDGKVQANMMGAGGGADLGGSVMGMKQPAAGTAGLGLNNLKQPTQMQPRGGPARPVVGPNPLANGGQGPSGGGMNPSGPLGMRAPLGPVTGMSPGGPVMNPVDLGAPVMSQPAGPAVSPPGYLQGGPSVPQRSPGFGGIRPLSQY